MAFRCIAFVLALLVAASAASSDIAKQVKETQQLGDSIPQLLQKQWTAKLAQQKKTISSAEAVLSKSLPGPVKEDVSAAIKQLNEVESKIEVALKKFVELQAKQAAEISKKYSTLLGQASNANGLISEADIHAVREESQKIVNSWVPALGKIHNEAHKQFETAFRSIAAKISKAKTPQIGDQIRVTIINLGAQLLNVLVGEQNADIKLLTVTQFNLYNEFFQKSESFLIDLSNRKVKNGVLTIPQSSSETPKPSTQKSNAKPKETQAEISGTTPKPKTATENEPSSQPSSSETTSSEEFDYDEYQN
ncbi:Conotoxin Pu5.6 [Frankliniella fusca]|uniref:Conotoxin Pu5.6 n=1 Tax=Frankliniella fusca TaxID=407009 RepID=A0AAE1I1L3_9NEOP|nr:Conotoxin Pu5.6 [Frankliniella fusca]